MEVIQARSAGFCFGVARAVRMAEELDAPRPRMLGEVIHNRHVTGALEARGMRVLTAPEEARAGDCVLIRAHGVGREVYRILSERGASVVDATCPRVARVQRIVEEADREGRQPVMIGDPDHPEVRGVGGWCRNLLVFSGMGRKPWGQGGWRADRGLPDHPPPGNLGRIFENPKKRVYKSKNI